MRKKSGLQLILLVFMIFLAGAIEACKSSGGGMNFPSDVTIGQLGAEEEGRSVIEVPLSFLKLESPDGVILDVIVNDEAYATDQDTSVFYDESRQSFRMSLDVNDGDVVFIKFKDANGTSLSSIPISGAVSSSNDVIVEGDGGSDGTDNIFPTNTDEDVEFDLPEDTETDKTKKITPSGAVEFNDNCLKTTDC